MSVSLENEVVFNLTNHEGLTPLMKAVKDGDKIKFQKLLNKGADPTVKGSRKSNALDIAVKYGRLEMARELINRKVKIINLSRALDHAASGANAQMIKLLCDQQTPTPEMLDLALITVIEKDDATTLRQLIPYNPRIGHYLFNLGKFSGGPPGEKYVATAYTTPLHWAFGHGKIQVLPVLAEICTESILKMKEHHGPLGREGTGGIHCWNRVTPLRLARATKNTEFFLTCVRNGAITYNDAILKAKKWKGNYPILLTKQILEMRKKTNPDAPLLKPGIFWNREVKELINQAKREE